MAAGQTADIAVGEVPATVLAHLAVEYNSMTTYPSDHLHLLHGAHKFLHPMLEFQELIPLLPVQMLSQLQELNLMHTPDQCRRHKV
jgi:hypothetical protein